MKFYIHIALSILLISSAALAMENNDQKQTPIPPSNETVNLAPHQPPKCNLECCMDNCISCMCLPMFYAILLCSGAPDCGSCCSKTTPN